MPLGSGLSSQVGIAQEGAYGVFTTPTRFLEFLTEGIAPDRPSLETRGIGDQFVRTSRRRAYIKSFGGQVEVDFMSSGMGILLKNMLGSIATTGTGPYTHTATPDAVGLQGLSMTVQVGKPQTMGVVVPFNYLGGKVHAWQLDQKIDQNLKLRLTYDFTNIGDLTSALAVASYPAVNSPLAFLDAVVTLDGVSGNVSECMVGGARAMAMDRRYLGNQKLEPIANGEYAVTGQISKEFEDTAIYGKFISGAVAALTMTHTFGATVLTTTIPAIEYTGANPAISGSDIVRQTIPFKALKNATQPIITLALTCADATP